MKTFKKVSYLFLTLFFGSLVAFQFSAHARGFLINKEDTSRKSPKVIVGEAPSVTMEKSEPIPVVIETQDLEIDNREVERLKKLLKKKERELNFLETSLEKEKKKSKALDARLRTFQSETSQMYEVKKGDNLWKISKRKDVYNKASLWIKIYNANMDRIQDPNLIFPGQLFRIPD